MTTVFKNGTIWNGLPKLKSEPIGCMVIKDNLIEYLGDGSDRYIAGLEQQKNVQVIDLQGHGVLPGFIDGHMHLMLFGGSLSKISLDKCLNLEDIRNTIRQATEQRPDAVRFFCRGWRQPTTDGRALASMLDDIDPRPIFIEAEDLHSTWCNTAALRELNVQDAPDPVGGRIHRDHHGKPSGLLSESAAVALAWPHFAKSSSMDEKLEYIRSAVRAYNAAGYTSIIDMAMDEGTWDVLQSLRDKEHIPIRLAAHWFILPSNTTEENLAQVERAIELHRQYNLSNSPDFRIAGIKIMCDGVIDTCTAALSQPYTSNNTNCEPLWSYDALKHVVHKADAANLQCALHAIGDAAVTLAIDALQSLRTTGRRHRIEHLELTRPEDAKRLGERGIIASIQPVHADPMILRAWPKLLGPQRCCRAFAYRDFLDHGARLAIGTDSPTAPHLPFRNLYIATTRRSARDPSSIEMVNEHFKLGLFDALSAATWGNAYSCFAEKITGSLDVGKKADFIIVDSIGDWESDPGSLLNAKVLETWFDGRRVF